MENKEIQLTPAEIEMIKVKREQEELEAKERALKRQAEIEKEIEICKQRIITYKKECETQRYQATLFKEEFDKIAPNSYSLIKISKSETFEVYRYKLKPEGGSSDKKEFFFEEKVNEEEYKIQRNGTNETMEVRFHIIYDTSTYRARPKNQYWAIEYGWNKFYKKAKTVHEKIEEKLAKQQREQKHKENKATAKETVLADLTKRYPGTRITFKEEYRSTYNGRGYRKSYDTNWTETYYHVEFENGLMIRFRFDETGYISTGEFMNLYKFDFNTIVEFMKQQTIKENK